MNKSGPSIEETRAVFVFKHLCVYEEYWGTPSYEHNEVK